MELGLPFLSSPYYLLHFMVLTSCGGRIYIGAVLGEGSLCVWSAHWRCVFSHCCVGFAFSFS